MKHDSYIKLEGEQFGPEDLLIAPDNITDQERLLIVSDLYNESLLYILDNDGILQTDSVINIFNEELTNLKTKQLLKSSTPQILDLYNKSENIAYRFKVTTHPLTFEEKELLYLPFGFTLMQEIGFLDNLIIGVGGRDFKIFVFDSHSQKSLKYTYDKNFEAVLKKHENFIPNANVYVNNDLRKFVVASSTFHSIELYNHKGKVLKSVYIGEDLASQINQFRAIDNPRDLTISFHDIFGTKDNIYLLYYNQKANELNVNPEDFKPLILVFDWDLNYIKTYELDRLTSKFIVNEDNKLIAITPHTNPQKLVKYSLH